jgi:hypothetical protein
MSENHEVLPKEAIAALEAGEYVKAVQCVMKSRQASEPEYGLAEAKALIDAYVATQPALQDKRVSSGSLSTWLIVLGFAVVVGLLAWSKQ